MIDAGLLQALVKIVELHAAELPLLKSSCDVMYRLAKDCKFLRSGVTALPDVVKKALHNAALGKLDVIHFLSIAMRQHLEERSAVALQTMIYLMSELVSNNGNGTVVTAGCDDMRAGHRAERAAMGQSARWTNIRASITQCSVRHLYE